MGKFKELAYGCWESWQGELGKGDTIDWVKIGKDNNTDAKTAESLAKGWEEATNYSDMYGP